MRRTDDAENAHESSVGYRALLSLFVHVDTCVRETSFVCKAWRFKPHRRHHVLSRVPYRRWFGILFLIFNSIQ